MTAVRPAKAGGGRREEGGGGEGMRFRLLPTDRAPDDLEKEMLDRWKEEKLFEQTLSRAEGKPEFVFFEGPPTANGQPGIHHVFARTVKDLFCRYRAMESFREIVPAREMTRLPAAPDTVSGLINLRGTIVTVLDGGITLGKPAFKRAEGLILLVEFNDRWIGFGVDDVRDIQDVPIDQFGSAEQSEIPVVGAVTGAVEIDGRQVLVLDIKTVVQQVIGQGR